VHDVVVGEAADDLRDRVGLTDVREELVAQPSPSLAPRTIPAMSTNDTAAGGSARAEHLGELREPRVGQVHDPTLGSIVANG
jgi:hypothetical protein